MMGTAISPVLARRSSSSTSSPPPARKCWDSGRDMRRWTTLLRVMAGMAVVVPSSLQFASGLVSKCICISQYTELAGKGGRGDLVSERLADPPSLPSPPHSLAAVPPMKLVYIADPPSLPSPPHSLAAVPPMKLVYIADPPSLPSTPHSLAAVPPMKLVYILLICRESVFLSCSRRLMTASRGSCLRLSSSGSAMAASSYE